MRKSQVLVVAVALFFCSAVAVQAQGIYEVVGVAKTAREGGGAELAGSVVLFLRTGDAGSGTITVEYSAPFAKGTGATVRRGGASQDAVDIASTGIDADENTVMVDLSAAGGDDESNVYTIAGVRLDVREATIPVMATVSGDGDAIVSGVVEVITNVEHALKVTSKEVSILTRGGVGPKNSVVTLAEGFRDAWVDGSTVLLRVSGIPNKAKWGVWHVQTMDENVLAAAKVGGPVSATIKGGGGDAVTNLQFVADDGTIAPGNAALVVEDDTGDTPVLNPQLDADGKDIDITITFEMPNDDGVTGTASLALEFGVDTGMENVPESMVTVMATMLPEEASTAADAIPDFFEENFTDAGTIFTFDPASCTLLFPYGVVLEERGWNTGIAISNPSAFGNNALSGAITFTLFMNGADPEMPPMTVTTGPTTAGALNDEGMLEAGNTYTVELSGLLEMAGHDGDFIGHLFAKTDFTGCRGVGWITDYRSVNQAYLPYFGDNLDQGGVPGNQ